MCTNLIILLSVLKEEELRSYCVKGHISDHTESEFCIVSLYFESTHNNQLLTVLDSEVKCALISLCFNKIF